MRNISSSLSAAKKISLGIFLLAVLLTGGTVGLSAHAQISYPDNLFASTNQAQLHELVLKATQENGQTNTVSGFKVDLTNVVSAPANSELTIFTTDNTISIIEAKVKSTTDAFIDLVKQNTNSFSLAGLPVGVYTLDVITQKGNTRAAYEGILVLGQEASNPQTRTIIEQQIIKEDDDDDDGENCDPSYPGACIPPYPPDLNCDDIQYKNFRVSPPDPHDFDREGDGIGCEANALGSGNNGQDSNGTSLLPPDPCLDNPSLCLDPCEVNPDTEECQEPLPPIDPCEEDPSLPECQEDTGEGSDSGDEGNGDSSDDENGDENDESGDTGGDEGGDGDEDGDTGGDEGEDAVFG